MVTPLRPQETLRVRIVRDRQGKVIGFQDPDKGAVFISRQSAIPRLRYSIERSRVEDSFGNEVGVGALGLPARGVEVAFKVKEASYKPLGVKPEGYQPRPNEEIIERVIVVDKGGKLVPIDTSYGLGKSTTRRKPGGVGGKRSPRRSASRRENDYLPRT